MAGDILNDRDIYGDEEADRQHRELFEKVDEFMRIIDGNVCKKDLLCIPGCGIPGDALGIPGDALV